MDNHIFVENLINLDKNLGDKDLEKMAKENFVPIITKPVASLLNFICKIIKPLNVLEIGTAIGYSGSLILKACERTHLLTIDIDLEKYKIAEEVFKKKGLTNRVRQVCNDAGDYILNLDEKFDLIFLDGPKTQYLSYLPTLLDLLNNGGILFADNVFFHGIVSGEVIDNERHATAKKINEFLNYLYALNGFTTTVVETGDGVSITVKD